ncbi:retropepsin-like aspartic protease [Planktosalinus lacus]|uniref:Aspartyl protease n=1 Tax=Planktosalinus lacus TaxID=1526573 RepID=A0A8J2Y9W4_9FLAO|nr:retropepsin-like aspartic protease [Planktosalinus lacus]GGE01299.1 hypothetical protein GCM10011312_25980 [Planktosalinus lacus]
MKNLNILLISIICLTSCNYLKNVNLLTSGDLERGNFTDSIPFRFEKDLIVVQAQINGKQQPLDFIFDTGAFNSKLESSLADNLGLEIIAEKTNSTAQGISQKIEVVQIDSLKLGESTFYNIGAGKLTYATTSASPCIADSGIIGANLIKLAHWKIDYENQLIHFSDSPFEVEGDSYVLPFKRPLLSGTPTINLEIEGKKVENILFDVGYNGGLVLPLSVANHFKNIESKIIQDQSTSGIYGTNTDSLLVKNLSVNVGGAKAQIPVEFSSLNKALLGNEFLKHFEVIINYDTKKIYLQKKKQIFIAEPHSFLVSIQNDSLWMVSRTTPNLLFQLGESLLSVNGKKPNDLFNSHCDFVMNVGRLLEKDNLIIEKMNGSIVKIK